MKINLFDIDPSTDPDPERGRLLAELQAVLKSQGLSMDVSLPDEDEIDSGDILIGEHNARTAAESQERLKGPIGQLLGVDHLFEQEEV